MARALYIAAYTEQVHPTTLVLILIVLVVVVFCSLGRETYEAKPHTPESAAPQVEATSPDPVEIPDIDWAMLGTWLRDYAAVKGSEGEWVGLDQLVEGLDQFARAAGESADPDTVDGGHLRELGEGIKRWTNADGERPAALWGALLTASEEPEAWGRLIRALGPALVAGAHEFGQEQRPKLVGLLAEVRIKIKGASGEARAKLEEELEGLKDAIATIDRTPSPSDSARKTWAALKDATGQKLKAETPEDE